MVEMQRERPRRPGAGTHRAGRATAGGRIGCWLLLALLMAGCGFSDSREAAAEVISRYFEAIGKRDYEEALTVFAETFFRDTAREARKAELEAHLRLFGDLESYKTVRWNVKKNVGANGGTFVQVTCKTRYSRQPAMEQFILKEAALGFRIIAHHIEAMNMPRGETHYI
jgi:alkanesulfonate monooxygenase SsuD/methylene tetrahydromethanopterin reductase-like flavin-dependent oxidoreductase (luciferase family)